MSRDSSLFLIFRFGRLMVDFHLSQRAYVVQGTCDRDQSPTKPKKRHVSAIGPQPLLRRQSPYACGPTAEPCRALSHQEELPNSLYNSSALWIRLAPFSRNQATTGELLRSVRGEKHSRSLHDLRLEQTRLYIRWRLSGDHTGIGRATRQQNIDPNTRLHQLLCPDGRGRLKRSLRRSIARKTAALHRFICHTDVNDAPLALLL